MSAFQATLAARIAAKKWIGKRRTADVVAATKVECLVLGRKEMCSGPSRTTRPSSRNLRRTSTTDACRRTPSSRRANPPSRGRSRREKEGWVAAANALVDVRPRFSALEAADAAIITMSIALDRLGRPEARTRVAPQTRLLDSPTTGARVHSRVFTTWEAAVVASCRNTVS